ncbi:hypothetical protein ACYCKW_06295 [Staphylococcus haemolyticus]|nr:hypothetical protein BUZ30_06315 [Staphylococcus haemolyticus]UVD88831.1 hypothetical protein NRZ53_08940 [Staphylococcus haemolyticus]WAI21538.1 MAG: hypothetical protein NRZ55_05860 [Staphylococcus haemolyticus]WAI22706.1 MAG: hypothetical protein NRZ54_11540 [Staphylococcus haemolyticus]
MWRVKELKDLDINDDRLAIEILEAHLLKYPNTQVLGYSVYHFENLTNIERSYILIKYWEDVDNDNRN